MEGLIRICLFVVFVCSFCFAGSESKNPSPSCRLMSQVAAMSNSASSHDCAVIDAVVIAASSRDCGVIINYRVCGVIPRLRRDPATAA